MIKIFLKIASIFPQKNHPFNEEKNGILDLNYSEHEYKTAYFLEDLFWKWFDFKKLKWKTVLDIWCGWWWKWVYLAEKYWCKIIWIDTEIEFVKQAQNIAKEKKVDNLCEFKIWDAHNLDFEENSIDYVILNDVIEHIPNTQKMFDEVHKVLKKWWLCFYNFAPYYELFGHHLWDTLPIPWLHIFTTESFRIKLYKESVKDLPDWEKRINLRIWKNKKWKETFSYLNRISRKKFLKIQDKFLSQNKFILIYEKQNFLKNLKFLRNFPILNELFSRLYVWILKKSEGKKNNSYIIKKWIKSLLFSIMRIYLMLIIVLFVGQKHFIFLPSNETYDLIYENSTELYIKTDSWNIINSIFIDNNSEKTVLYFHWNWWNIYYLDHMIEVFNDLKLNGYIFDYRWYWKSTWEIKDESDLYHDNNFVYDYIIKSWVKPENIILWWQSLWWAMAIDTAQNKDNYALIVESSFYSMWEMAHSIYPFIPTKILLKYKFDSYKKLKNINTKALFMHSKKDEIINYAQWIKLYNYMNWEKYFYELNWTHNWWFLEDYDGFIANLKDFLKIKS